MNHTEGRSLPPLKRQRGVSGRALLLGELCWGHHLSRHCGHVCIAWENELSEARLSTSWTRRPSVSPSAPCVRMRVIAQPMSTTFWFGTSAGSIRSNWTPMCPEQWVRRNKIWASQQSRNSVTELSLSRTQEERNRRSWWGLLTRTRRSYIGTDRMRMVLPPWLKPDSLDIPCCNLWCPASLLGNYCDLEWPKLFFFSSFFFFLAEGKTIAPVLWRVYADHSILVQ